MSFPLGSQYSLVPKRSLYGYGISRAVLSPASPFIHHVILGKSFSFSMFQSCHLPYQPHSYRVYKMVFTIILLFPKTETEHLQSPRRLCEVSRTLKGKTQNLLSRIQWRRHTSRQSNRGCCGTRVGMGVGDTQVSRGHRRLHKTCCSVDS